MTRLNDIGEMRYRNVRVGLISRARGRMVGFPNLGLAEPRGRGLRAPREPTADFIEGSADPGRELPIAEIVTTPVVRGGLG